MTITEDLFRAFNDAWVELGGLPVGYWRYVWGCDTLGYWYSGCAKGHLHMRLLMGCAYSPDARILRDYFFFSFCADTTGRRMAGWAYYDMPATRA